MTQTKLVSEGRFIPKRPGKYCGDVDRIWFRSHPELQFMNFLDRNLYVTSWSSEHPGTSIDYKVDGVTHKYYPDFIVKFSTSEVNKRKNKLSPPRETTCLIELKPESQFNPKSSSANEELIRVNRAKFLAAQTLCEERGWEFRVLDISQIS